MLGVSGSTFEGGNASLGGALFISVGATAIISTSVLHYNSASVAGGGVYVAGQSGNGNATNVTLSDVSIHDNLSQGGGGGVFVSTANNGPGTQLLIDGGSQIHNNHALGAGSGLGGGIYVGAGTITFDNAWIANNTAANGDGMYRVVGTTKVLGPGGVTWFGNQEVVGPA